ncbi:MAG: hypothetical protein AAGF53_07325 [Pseudomonadota bacterium]
MEYVRFVVISSLLVSTACSQPATKSAADLLVDECRKITGVDGAYSWTQEAIPLVTPVAAQGGTERGATILNACIDSKTRQDGDSSGFSGATSNVNPTTACPKKKSSSVFSGGASYCG